MKMKALLLGCLLLATPCVAQLPSEPMPGETTSPSYQSPTPQHQQPPQPQTAMVPHVDFDFKGFFDYFVKIYGKNGLTVFQQKMDERKAAEGLATQTIPGIPIPCGLAPAVSGSTVTYENPNRRHGSTATYKCELGYQGADAIIMCISGAWTNATVNCNMVFCGRPSLMPNARTNFQDSSYGSTATYTCDPGYQADEIANPIKCQADGTWSKPNFRCASNQQMSSMSNPMASAGMGVPGGAGGGMMGSMPGLSSGLMGVVAQAMSAGPAGGNGAAAGGLGNMFTSLFSNSMGGTPGPVGGEVGGMMANLMAAMGGGGMMGGATGAAPGAALPEHLQGLGSMTPALMPSFLGGMSPNFGAGAAGGVGGAAASPMEPEKQQEHMMMMAMMANMQNQRMQQMQHQRQMQLQQQQQMEAQKRQQQEAAERQAKQQESGINLSNILTAAQAASSGGNTQVMSALQTLQQALNQMMPAGGAAPGSSTTGTAPSGTATGTNTSSSSSSGPISVFGSSSSSSSSSSTSAASSNTGSDPIRDAVMAAALG